MGERVVLKTLTLRSQCAPPLLAVHLKRFAFDMSSGSMTKVCAFIKTIVHLMADHLLSKCWNQTMSAVRIPRELHLPVMECDPNLQQSAARYTLSSIVVHEGEL